MFPPAAPQTRAQRRTPGSQLSPRGRLLAAVGVGAVLLVMVLGSWLSIRAFTRSSPVYLNGATTAATTWTWDGVDFKAAATGAGPSSNHTDLAYDAARGTLLAWDHGCAKLVMGFWGGCQAGVNQVWTWNGSAWTKQASNASPEEIGAGVMTFDSRLRQVVYVNGVGRVWAWGDQGWRPLSTPGGPHVEPPGSAARSDTFAAGYDETRGLLIYALTTSTWTWDGRSWTSLPSGIPLAEARGDAHLVHDRDSAQLVYVGQRQTWIWDGTQWTSHDQPALVGATLAYDPLRKYVLALRQDPSSCSQSTCSVSAWTWSGTAWTPLRAAHPPLLAQTRSGAHPPPMAFDEARGEMVFLAATS